MNDVQCLIDRQLGLCSHFNYDSVLRRLVVTSEEEECYYGLQNASDRLDGDPPIFACRFAEAPGYEHILALANEDGRVALQDTSKIGSSLEGIQCHNNAVFDLAWNPYEMSFVTVSGDHTACVWAGGARLARRLAGHARSVRSAAWRAADELATGGRDGHVLLWDLRVPQHVLDIKPDQCIVHAHGGRLPRTPGSRRTPPRPPRACSVTALALTDAHTLLSAGEGDGAIKVWDLRKHHGRGRALPRGVLPYAGGSARRGYSALVAAPPRLYAAAMDGVIYCYNVAALAPAPLARYAGHESGSFYIRAAVSADQRYLASGSSDAHAYVWRVGRAQPVLRLAGHRAEVTCVAMPRAARLELPLLATCGDDARHKLWRVGREDLEPSELRGRASPPPRREPPLPASPRAPSPRAASPRAAPAPPRAPRSKRCLASLLAAAAPPAKRRREEPGRKRAADDGTADEPAADASPAKLPRCGTPSPPRPEGRVVSFSTPTKQLPDFVRDGAAPHLRLMSPARPRREAPDWLTALRRRKLPAPAPGPPAAPPPARRPSPPPARRAPTPERAPPRPPPARTLLSYFTPAPRRQ